MNRIQTAQAEGSPLALPDSWADQLDLRRPTHLWRFLRKVLLRRLSRVQLPEGLPVNVAIPKYALQEFHNLPNGNYSKNITHGYSRGFDIVMLGLMHEHRRTMAAALNGCDSVVDIGCGAGHSTAALTHIGVREIWGLDPSPYLLQHAAQQYPQHRFVQGLAEETGLADGHFDGIAVCFVFHEIPPKPADEALVEFRRILKPGGRLSILEPATEQFFGRPWTLFRAHGWKGLYFWWLARFVHEPFVRAWQDRDIPRWLSAHGFRLVSDQTLFPSRLIVAERAQ